MRKWRFLAPIGFLAIVAGLSAVVMLLWNWLLPVIFGLTTINFWQAFGILALSKILFSSSIGFGRHSRHHHGMRHRNMQNNVIHEKWQKMSEEERREFLKHRGHFGFGRDFFNSENGENDESK